MTRADQVTAIQQFGYTAREASFIAAAVLHSGYFLRRQFGSKGGKRADTLCKKVLAYHHADATRFASKTYLYHLRSKALYRALGQQDNRHRRGHDPFHVRSKVMGLDYVLLHPAYRFLPTEEDKLAFFCGERNLAKSLLPTKTYAGKGGNTERFFVDKYPIRIDSERGGVAFCYIDDGAFAGLGFGTWLAQYDALISGMGDAEVVYVSSNPASFELARRQFSLQFSTVNGGLQAELLSYFEIRKDLEVHGSSGRTQAFLDSFRKLNQVYGEPRFQEQYTAWRGASQPALPAFHVGFSTYHLDYAYRFLGVTA